MSDLKEHRIATSPEEAVIMLKAGPGKGCFLAGGTNLNIGNTHCDYVVDIKQAGLSGIAGTNMGDVLIGATTCLQDCIESEVLQKFAGGEVCKVAAQCGQRSRRENATIGGNICHALPSADMAPVLMALDAVCFIVDDDSQESLPLHEFFVDAGQTILEQRLLAGFALPNDVANWVCETHKLTTSSEESALVQVAVSMAVEDEMLSQVRIALGGVDKVPLRCHLAEDQLTDLKLKDITPEIVEIVSVIAAGECDPVDDSRASAEYRKDQVRILTKRLICRVLAGHGMIACTEEPPAGDNKGGAA